MVEGRLKCSYCAVATPFQKLADFKEHLRTNHETHQSAALENATDTDKFEAECEFCHKKFATLKGLGTHRRTHKNPRENSEDLQKTEEPNAQAPSFRQSLNGLRIF